MFIFFPVLHGLNKTRLEEQNEREREGEGRCESGGELKQHLMEIPTTTEREREKRREVAVRSYAGVMHGNIRERGEERGRRRFQPHERHDNAFTHAVAEVEMEVAGK